MPTSPYVINAVAIYVCVGTWLTSGVGGQEACPDQWWEEPVQSCGRDLVDFISTDNAHLSSSDRINETCKLWKETRECFRRLIAVCPDQAAEIRRRMMHHAHVSEPCYDKRMRYRQELVDCYSHYVGPTQKCRGSFDRYYFDLVLNKDYGGACRVLATVIKCLHGNKVKVQEECQPDGAKEYHGNYIRPLLEQVSGRVRRRCHMSPPYNQYVGGAMSSYVPSWLVTWCATCLLLLWTPNAMT